MNCVVKFNTAHALQEGLEIYFNNLHYILGNVSYPKERSFTLYVTKTILSDYSKKPLLCLYPLL